MTARAFAPVPALAAAAFVAASAAAQQSADAQDPAPRLSDVIKQGSVHTHLGEEYYEAHVYGGFRIEIPGSGIEVRGGNALLLLDLDAWHDARRRQPAGELPTRGALQPDPRRRLSPEQIRARLTTSLRSLGRPAADDDPELGDKAIDLLRHLYCEGGVVVVRDGIEVIRCDRLWISPVDDRVVVENAEVRYLTGEGAKAQTTVVRAPRLTKQGRRWTGRDVTVTNCTAAVPHAALAVDELEILEHEREYEIVSRGATLQIGSTNLLPLPNTRVFSGSQSDFPFKRISVGYSNRLGYKAQVGFGQTWNGTGGALHHWLLGRPASEFRGDWELGVGWIQRRGLPLEGTLNYQAPGLYRGSTEAFFLDDTGTNVREITADRAGNTIDTQNRGLLRTQNRLQLGERTTLDLVAYRMTDPSVWSEFFPGAYRTEETPETSAFLAHADGNRLFTLGARTNLNDFNYRDDRALANKFTEELPVATYQWLAQPIGKTPWKTPIVVDIETNVGERRSNYDDRASDPQPTAGSPGGITASPYGPPVARVSDSTLRLDQLAELSAPMQLGSLSVRPYMNGRGTWYDDTVGAGAEGRMALEAGVQMSTRLQRTWSWMSDGERQSIRHVMSPKLTWRDRYHVDDQPAQFHQFDSIDAITEVQLVRPELRNQVQKMAVVDGVRQPRDFLFFDFAQDVFPDRARDNQGRTLGLFYYDVMIRPDPTGLPVKNLSYAIYGDHDWKRGLRTLDTEVQFGPLLGVNWGVDYRRDYLVQGAVGVQGNTKLFERWDVFGGTQRDLNRDIWLSYMFGVRRNDHDWSIETYLVYNPFTAQTTFNIDFVPRMGGGGDQPRRDRFGNGSLQSPLRAPH